MRIAIAGCGIAGTAVASLLSSDGHSVTIFEQAEVCRPVGAGIMLQPSGQTVLERLGIREAIAAKSSPLDGLEARLANGRSLVRLRYATLDPNSQAWGVHRGELFDQLLTLCRASGVSIETSSRINGYETDDQQVLVTTESGETSDGFDYLIAADGSRSSLRIAAGIPSNSVEYPYGALWMTGRCDEIDDRLFQVVDGTRRLVGLLPIGPERCSFFWGLRGDGFDALRQQGVDRWKREVGELCPQAASLLEPVDSFDQLTFASYRHVSMRRWCGNRIVFVGDAAHPSSPHLGQGVNLALEDAVSFADALRESDGYVALASRRYERDRWRKIRYYQQLTRLLTPFFQSDGKVLGWGRDVALPWFPVVPWVHRRMLRTLCGLQCGWLS